MKARLSLVVARSDGARVYGVVFRGKQVGEVYRRGHDKNSLYGREPWYAIAYLANEDAVHQEDSMIRRGDAKRWVLQNQTELA